MPLTIISISQVDVTPDVREFSPRNRHAASRSWSLLFVFLLHIDPAEGQIQRNQFVHWTTEQGLSSFRLYSVVQDCTGFIWVGTLQGLNRYDGNGFKVYVNQENTATSLSSNLVRILNVDSKGTLWAGTEDGLNRLAPGTETFLRYRSDSADSNSLSGNHITAICEVPLTATDRKPRAIWIGTESAGLNKFATDANTFVRFRHQAGNEQSIRSDSITALACDNAGRLWVGTTNGLDMFDDPAERFVRIVHPVKGRSSRAFPIAAIHCDHSGTLWVGTANNELFTFDPATGTWVAYLTSPDDALDEKPIRSILEQDNRYIWVATQAGLKRFDRRDSIWSSYTRNENDASSLTDDYVRSLTEDRSGNLWIATDSRLSMLSHQRMRFRRFAMNENSLADQTVTSLLVRNREELWIGTASSGIHSMNLRTGKTKTAVPPSQRRRLKNVSVLYQSNDGTLWAALGDPPSLARYDTLRQAFSFYPAGSYIHCIEENTQGVLYLGTSDSIRVFDTRSNRFVENDLRTTTSKRVRCLNREANGSLWFGSGSEVIRWDFQSRTSRRFDAHAEVYALHRDSSGGLWVATHTGFGRLDIITGKITPQLIIPNSNRVIVYNIFEDVPGRLWLSTIEHGIVRFDTRRGSFSNYTADDGLAGNILTKAAARTVNGELVFGGRGGFTIFHPDSLVPNPSMPNVTITKFQLISDPEGTQYLPGHAFGPAENSFIAEFAALEFTNPAKNRFLYRLKPTDGWIDPRTQRILMIPNLGDDDYVFEVTASNNDGTWSAASRAFHFSVEPPFTKTKYFYAIIMVVIGGLIAAAYKYRIQQLLAMEVMRGRIASDLHDDVGSSMSGIALRIELVKAHLPPETKDHLQLATAVASTRKTQDKLRDIVSFINPEHDDPGYLVIRMKEVAGELLLNHRYTFESPPEGIPTGFNMEFRWNLHLIYKEILNNVVKSAQAANVTIRLQSTKELFSMIIGDDGVGFDFEAAKRKGGNGLLNLEHRAEKIGAAIVFTTSPGNGTMVVVSATIPPSRYGNQLGKFVSYVTNNSRH